MSDDGIIRIGRKGKKKICFQDADGKDGPIIDIDVIELHNAWVRLDSEFRDEKGEVDKARLDEFNQAACEFVAEVVGQTEAAKEAYKDLSKADVLQFIKHLTDEATALVPFFAPKPVAGLNSPPSTELIFSN